MPGIHGHVFDLSTPELTATSSAERCYLVIRTALLAGDFPPGARLKERQLSLLTNMSRTPVREAITRLQTEGLLVGTPSGLRVAQLRPEDIRKLYQTRVALEALAASEAAARMRLGELAPAQIQKLRDDADSLNRLAAAGDARGAARANIAFHQRIAMNADNQFILNALEPLWDRITISSTSNFTDEVWRTEVADQHLRIIEAIADGDSSLVADLMKQHIARAADVYSNTKEELKH